MPVNTYDASIVMKEVLNRYGDYLPGDLVSYLRSANPARIFRILPAKEYTPQFDAYFRSFFVAINVVALGGIRKMIGLANSGASIACPAFCAPAIDITQRRIYVNRDAGVTIGTLYHEFIHFLEHPNFYPEFYATGGASPNILEGVTEYLTRAVSSKVKQDRFSQRKYQAWLDQISSSLGLSSTGPLDDRVARLAFQGDFTLVPQLGGTVPRL